MNNGVLESIWRKFFAGKSSAWMGIFTCILTVFTGIQVWMARISNENAIATQRAFVIPAGQVPGSKVVHNGKIARMAFILSFENSGVTPARRALGRSNVQLFQNSLPENYGFPDLSDSVPTPVSIGPKVTATQSVGVPISDVIAASKDGHLYTWGWIAYDDVFRGTPRRLVEFCYELAHISATLPDFTDPKAEFNWISLPCRTHNCQDQDCPDYNQKLAGRE